MQSGIGYDSFHAAKYGFFGSGLSQGQDGGTGRLAGFAGRIQLEQGRARGEHIVDEQKITTSKPIRIDALERAIQVFTTLIQTEAGLCAGVPRADEPFGSKDLSAGGLGHAKGDGRRLVVSSLAQALGVQWNRNNEPGADAGAARRLEAEFLAQLWQVAVFQAVKEVLDDAILVELPRRDPPIDAVRQNDIRIMDGRLKAVLEAIRAHQAPHGNRGVSASEADGWEEDADHICIEAENRKSLQRIFHSEHFFAEIGNHGAPFRRLSGNP